MLLTIFYRSEFQFFLLLQVTDFMMGLMSDHYSC